MPILKVIIALIIWFFTNFRTNLLLVALAMIAISLFTPEINSIINTYYENKAQEQQYVKEQRNYHLRSGNRHYFNSSYTSAIEQYQKSLSFGESKEVFFFLARSYEELGMSQQSLDAYKKGIIFVLWSQDTTLEKMYALRMAAIEEELQSYEQAIKYYDRLIELGEDVFFLKARCLVESGQYQEAYDLYRYIADNKKKGHETARLLLDELERR